MSATSTIAKVLACATVAALFGGSGSADEHPGAAAEGDTAEGAAVAFVAQASGGRMVQVDSVTLPEGGFVALHDATLLSEEDPFGSVAGVSAFLPPGTHRNLWVALHRDLEGTNETLIAMPHLDSNNNQLYDFVTSAGEEDGPYVGGPQAQETFAGNIVLQPATVNVTAAVHAQAQRTPGTSLLVDWVEMGDGGFLAVHDATLLSEEDPFGSVLGVTPFLEPGLHRDVLVTFDFERPAGNGSEDQGELRRVSEGPLVPMPHQDTNGNRAYDFVSSQGAEDGPFAGNVPTFVGNIVLAAVNITVDMDADIVFGPTTTGGSAMVVPEVYLPEEGFVALHDSTLLSQEDPFGSVLGVSAPLPAGLHRNVTVELADVPGVSDNDFDGSSDTIIAMPHKDSNGDGVYDFVTSEGAEDGPFAGARATATFAGPIVLAAANVNRTALAWVGPGEVADGRVVVSLVDLSERGFLALHDASLLAGDAIGSVVGVSEVLDAGLHRNVTVTLGDVPGGNATFGASGLLVAMPHRDTNGNGAYDFVRSEGEDDGPFVGAVGTPQGIVLSAAFVTTTATSGSGATGTTGGQGEGGNETDADGATGTTGDAAQDDRQIPGLGVAAAALAAVGGALLLRRRRT